MSIARADAIDICLRYADQYGIPRLLLLACGIAESNLDSSARRPAHSSDDARFWPDVSGGLFQQTVRFDPDYRGGSDYPGPDETDRVLRLQFDPNRAADVACRNLQAKWAKYGDVFKTLCAYNWPGGNGQPFSPAHEQNYRRGMAEAATILRAIGGTMPDSSGPTYVFPVEGYPRQKIPLHWDVSPHAADLFAPRGSNIRAMVSGRIDDASFNSLGGWSVYLIGDPDTKSLHYYMAHMNEKPLVNTGDRVLAGRVIGHVGDTGNAAGKGTHLHIGIGHGIQDGSGPEGGAGIGYDANAYLQRVLDVIGSGAVGDVPSPQPPTETLESYGIRMRYIRDTVAPAARDAWRNLEEWFGNGSSGRPDWQALGAAIDSLERTAKDG